MIKSLWLKLRLTVQSLSLSKNKIYQNTRQDILFSTLYIKCHLHFTQGWEDQTPFYLNKHNMYKSSQTQNWQVTHLLIRQMQRRIWITSELAVTCKSKKENHLYTCTLQPLMKDHPDESPLLFQDHFLKQGGNSSVGRASDWKQVQQCCRNEFLVRQGIFLPELTFSADSLAVSVQLPCAITRINICMHIKSTKHWQPYPCLDTWKYCAHGQE